MSSFLEHFPRLEDQHQEEFVIRPLPEILLEALIRTLYDVIIARIFLYRGQKPSVLFCGIWPYTNGISPVKTFWHLFEFLDT